MNDYGSTSRGRPLVRSPNPHAVEDGRGIKKKYEQTKEALKAERKNVEFLEGTVKELRDKTHKQERELLKKEEQIDILL